ncbi:alpha/beta hydrolase family protein [Aeoliella mucimassa]|uniref:Alpha/beta hydrolase family protein n=1 Tax=Aeoliella mucimassa TaxID=2527972 RepID=A0A518ALM2_9BACT|nr:dienelactone hydrolase [Aeoliella mucimassa]QDU55619.1 Alpha/beta hydrolase family protein [Aeoliella mucimassa]
MLLPKLKQVSLVLALGFSAALAQAEGYDPLQVDDLKLPEPIDLTINDTARDREIPVRIYLPVSEKPVPVVLFSHGLGGSCKNNPYLGQHWSARGYVIVFMQHAGSDETVWQDVPRWKIMSAMSSAASGKNIMDRVRDVSVVLDQLTRWNEAAASDPTAAKLAGRLDLDHVGMSGHSFGAVTTQAVAGQAFGGRSLFAESRIDAAVLMSPSTPRRGSASQAFGEVSMPWLLLTGTHDAGRIGDQTPESRQQVYPALPTGGKFQLVLNGAEHSAFGDRELPGDREPRNPNHHKAILATTTAFWDTYLLENQQAKAWIESEQVRQVLESDDKWDIK